MEAFILLNLLLIRLPGKQKLYTSQTTVQMIIQYFSWVKLNTHYKTQEQMRFAALFELIVNCCTCIWTVVNGLSSVCYTVIKLVPHFSPRTSELGRLAIMHEIHLAAELVCLHAL